MGLAPYGQPTYLEKMRQIVPLAADGTYSLDLDYFRHARERLPHQWSSGTPVVGEHFSAGDGAVARPGKAAGPTARAASQGPRSAPHRRCTRRRSSLLLKALHRRYGVDQPGDRRGLRHELGCQRQGRRPDTPFKRVYVQSAAGRCAAAPSGPPSRLAPAAWVDQRSPRHDACVSRAASPVEAKSSELLSCPRPRHRSGRAAACGGSTTRRHFVGETAAAIADGRVVGWFQGRMEWGPRALGNRSISAIRVGLI